jgi:hypothetical protein
LLAKIHLTANLRYSGSPLFAFKIEPQYEELWGFAGDVSVVKVGSKYGFIDKSGKIAIAPRFDEADSFSEEHASELAPNMALPTKLAKLSSTLNLKESGLLPMSEHG